MVLEVGLGGKPTASLSRYTGSGPTDVSSPGGTEHEEEYTRLYSGTVTEMRPLRERPSPAGPSNSPLARLTDRIGAAKDLYLYQRYTRLNPIHQVTVYTDEIVAGLKHGKRRHLEPNGATFETVFEQVTRGPNWISFYPRHDREWMRLAHDPRWKDPAFRLTEARRYCHIRLRHDNPETVEVAGNLEGIRWNRLTAVYCNREIAEIERQEPLAPRVVKIDLAALEREDLELQRREHQARWERLDTFEKWTFASRLVKTAIACTVFGVVGVVAYGAARLPSEISFR